MTAKKNRKLIRNAQAIIGIRLPKVPQYSTPHSSLPENGGDLGGFTKASSQVAKVLKDI